VGTNRVVFTFVPVNNFTVEIRIDRRDDPQ
jgi:hypothetical protein